jgi:hypothetical protein
MAYAVNAVAGNARAAQSFSPPPANRGTSGFLLRFNSELLGSLGVKKLLTPSEKKSHF